jgi:uncharacterized damage-inducible protein DinB
MFANRILPEFDQEMAITRRLLERLPEHLLDWRPHPKSNTIGWNANHLAELPGWVENALTEPLFDINPPEGPPYATGSLASRDDILIMFDQNVAQARSAIEQFDEKKIDEVWHFCDNGNVLFSMTRGAVLRTFVISHIVHHRAIMSVYYRLNDIPVPAIYGPSGDETQ